jgi:hypothetical protein
MSLLTKDGERNEASEAQVSGAALRFKTSLRLRLQSFKEAVATGEIPEGTIWLVRIIEAGQSLNGDTYTDAALKASVAVFEGAPVFNYAWSEDPAAKDAGHLPDEISAIDSRGLTGNQVGSLEGVHFNEQARALDAYLKVYDSTLRERMVTAFKLGDIGEGGKRDTFGLSIDALGDRDEHGNVTQITTANSVDLVSKAAAGGRIRRLVAAQEQDEDERLTEEFRATEFADLPIVDEPWNPTEKPDSEIFAEILGPDGSDWERMRKAHLTWDPEKPDQIGGYKLKVARVHDGRLTAFFRQLASRVAIIQGARAGVDLPEDVKLSALRHAKKYYDKLGKPFPVDLGEDEPKQEESVPETIKENVATFAGKLKLMADQLSAAPDDQALPMLEAIKEEITAAIKEYGSEVAEEPTDDSASQEAKSVSDNEQTVATNATQDDFARMSAGMEKVKEALKSGDSKRLREAAVEAVGEEPQQDERDREIESLKERLKEQAITSAMAKLTEELKLVDPATTLLLLDRAGLSFGEDYQEVSGLKEAIRDVIKTRPYLVMVEEAKAETETETETEHQTESVEETKTEAKPETETKAEPLGQNVPLRESVKPAQIEVTPSIAAKLKRLQRRMKGGDVSAMKEHRDLRTQCGL